MKRKRIISGILTLSIVSTMSGFQNIYAVDGTSEITISDAVMPEGILSKGSSFGLRGNISSVYNLKTVEAEIVLKNTENAVQYVTVSPDTTEYNIHPEIDYAIIFDELKKGNYTYILNAEDIKGYKKNLITSDFQIGTIEKIAGDANIDGNVDVADVVAVASYVADSKKNPLDYMGISNADVQGGGDGLTAGDALAIQQYLAGIIGKLENQNSLPVITTTTTATTTAVTQTETVTESSAVTTNAPVSLGLSDFIADSYYKCCGTTASEKDIESMTRDITSGNYSLEELLLNLINYNFSDDRGENSDYASCVYNSMLKRNLSDSELSQRTSQLDCGKSRFALFLEVAKSAEFKAICQKYNVSDYRASLGNIYPTVQLNATHDIYNNASFYSSIGTAQNEQILSVTGFTGEWLEVKFLDGKGYIMAEYVSPYGNSSTKVLPVSNIPQNSYIGGSPLPTGCEVTSLSVLMNYLRFENAGKNTLANGFMPKGEIGSTDPNYAFIGSPESSSSYGAYANTMVRTANSYLSANKINNYSINDITGADMENLYEQIDNGNPVLVWITMYCTPSRNYGATWNLKRGTYYTEPGTGTYSFTWKKSEHCCVLVGYNKAKGTVILADVLEGDALTEYTIPEFESAYRWLGNQAVTIS